MRRACRLLRRHDMLCPFKNGQNVHRPAGESRGGQSRGPRKQESGFGFCVGQEGGPSLTSEKAFREHIPEAAVAGAGWELGWRSSAEFTPKNDCWFEPRLLFHTRSCRCIALVEALSDLRDHSSILSNVTGSIRNKFRAQGTLHAMSASRHRNETAHLMYTFIQKGLRGPR